MQGAIVRPAAVLGGAALLAMLVLRTTAVAVIPPELSSGSVVLGDSPEPALVAARRAVQSGYGQPMLERMREAARQAPLAEEPYLLAASVALRRGDRARAVALLEEVRRRNPRQRYARLLLVENYARAGEVGKATREVIALQRLIPDANELLVSQLAMLASDPQTMGAARIAIRDENLLNAVLENLASSNAAPRVILNLAGNRRFASPDARRWQTRAISNLLDTGQYRLAHQLWEQFNAIEVPDAGRVYDPRFTQKEATPPFGWLLHSDQTGTAERASRGGLEVSYFGRVSGELARQVVLLDPGQHRLSVTGEGTTKDQPTALQWTLTCLAGGKPIATLSLDALTYAPKALQMTFAVPAQGCAAQVLALVGKAADLPAPINVTIHEAAVDPARSEQ